MANSDERKNGTIYSSIDAECFCEEAGVDWWICRWGCCPPQQRRMMLRPFLVGFLHVPAHWPLFSRLCGCLLQSQTLGGANTPTLYLFINFTLIGARVTPPRRTTTTLLLLRSPLTLDS